MIIHLGGNSKCKLHFTGQWALVYCSYDYCHQQWQYGLDKLFFVVLSSCTYECKVQGEGNILSYSYIVLLWMLLLFAVAEWVLDMITQAFANFLPK